MPQDARPSQRNEANRWLFPPMTYALMNAGGRRHRPRKLTIKYSRAPEVNREAAAYWIPAFAGMTVFCWETQGLPRQPHGADPKSSGFNSIGEPCGVRSAA